jgi:hypothetical protein
MAEEVPADPDAAGGVCAVGSAPDREALDLVLGLLDPVLSEQILAGAKGLLDPLGYDSLADRDEGDAGGIDTAAPGGAADALVDLGEGLRDRRRAVWNLVDQVLWISSR